MSVCLIARNRLSLRFLVEEPMANNGIPLAFLCFCSFDEFLHFIFFSLWVFWFLQTSLLCMVGELAGGGLVAVAVGICDR